MKNNIVVEKHKINDIAYQGDGDMLINSTTGEILKKNLIKEKESSQLDRIENAMDLILLKQEGIL